MLGESIKKIKGSLLLKAFGLLSILDYSAYVVFSALGWIHWQKSLILFFFSIVTWFFTVSWLPYWSEAIRIHNLEAGRRLNEFLETFALLALILVHCLYTAILPFVFVHR